MNQKFIRIYKKMDMTEVKRHLLLYGDLSGQCGECQAMDVKLEMKSCPQCGTSFKYIAFRNVRDHVAKLQKLANERPDILLVDYDDFKRHIGAMKAHDLLK